MREKLEDLFYSIQEKYLDLKKSLFAEEDEDDWYEDDLDMDIEEYEMSPRRNEKQGFLQERPVVRFLLSWLRRFRIAVFIAVLAASSAIGFFVYNKIVTFEDYTVAASYENSVSVGTGYRAAGRDILKYNSDGVTCVSRNNDLRWSITYSMQSPVVDVCGTTMAIGEQHGTQVFVVDKDGQIGSFSTELPILKVRVSNQGVVAAMLQEDEVTWINLYRPDGTLIASDKTTIPESGYPLDIALSPDGERMVVSYLGITDGVLGSTVSFYDFGKSGQEEKNNMTNSQSFEGTAVPVVYYADDSHIVAVLDDGFVVFEGGSSPKMGEPVKFDTEIISSFHEENKIGFVFENEGTESKYRIELYNLSGKQRMALDTDYAYTQIKMENGQVMMYNDKSFRVYTDSGHLWFASDYEKEVVDFYYFSEYRRYLVITQNSFDRIRIKNGEESE